MKKLFLVILFAIATSIANMAQVTSNFDTGDEGWRTGGDQNSYWEPTGGNPGGCFRVDDYATGPVNRAYAPVQYLGDWSMAESTDWIGADIFLHIIDGSYFTGNYVFKIIGPGGSAKAFSPAPTPSHESWTYYEVDLAESDWVVESGTWDEILQYVTKLIVTMEYVDGDEYCVLDNVSLSFTPITVPIEPGVGYSFEWSIDGWLFENTTGVTLEPIGGFPDQYVKILDESGALSKAHPPSTCHGDWSLLDGHNAEIMMDLKITNIGGTPLLPDWIIKANGPGGEATYPCPENISLAFDQWHSFGIPINESDWIIINGNWPSLLDYVTDVEVIVEFIDGDETVGIDNFYISNSMSEADFAINEYMNDYNYYQTFGSYPAKFVNLSISAPKTYHWDFDDGTTSTEVNPEHLFMPGSHDVSLTVSNHFGSDTETKENYITVYPIDQCYKYGDDFDDNSISTVWDTINGTWIELGGTLQQTSNYYEWGNYLGGCYALVGSSSWEDIVVSFDVMSTDDDWIGLVFNWQDEDNMYMFRWCMQESDRILSKWIDGVEIVLASDNVPYSQNTWYNIEAQSVLGELSINIDDIPVFSVTDNTFTSGKVGLYCYGNQSTFYDNIVVECNRKSVELRVCLEGANNGLDMNTDLLDAGCLPTSHPYGGVPWNHPGTETVVEFPPDVVDWVLVEFRDAESAETATAATSIGKKAALLLKDGSIVSPYGGQPLHLNQEITNELFVCIYHRNHIGIMSAFPVEEFDGTYTYDFTQYGPDPAYGDGQKAITTSGFFYAMWAGDTDANGVIDNTDKFYWENQVGESGYIPSDSNLDGQGNNNDKNDWLIENIGVNSQIPE